MAVANTKSTIVTNGDANPRVHTPALIMGGRLREQVATVETAAADDAGSVYRLCRVHSSWRISDLELAHDAVTGMTTADIGVYQTAENGGAVVDVDFFGNVVDISSASTGFVSRLYEATATDIVDCEQRLWEKLGLTADSNRFYDIAVTATTNDPSVAVTISMRVRYCDGT